MECITVQGGRRALSTGEKPRRRGKIRPWRPLRIQFIYSQQTVHVMYRDHAPRDVVRASGVVKAWSSVTGLFSGGVRPDVMNPARRARVHFHRSKKPRTVMFIGEAELARGHALCAPSHGECPLVIGGAARSPQREHESEIEIAAQEMAAQAVRPRPRLPAARWDLLARTTRGYRDFAPVHLAVASIAFAAAPVPPSPARGLTNSSKQSCLHSSSSLHFSPWSRARLARLVRSHTSLCPVPLSALLRPCAPASLL